MFKAQPLKHVAPFAAAVFITSLAASMYPFHFVLLSLSQTLKTYLPGILLCTTFSGLAFWVGLGISHRVPNVRKTFFLVAIFYSALFVAAENFVAFTKWYMIFFGLAVAFPLFLGACWPAAWANNSFKADASGAA